MSIHFSQDVIPLSDLKANPGRVLRRVAESNRPALITQRGRGIAVVQSLDRYEKLLQELEMLRRRQPA